MKLAVDHIKDTPLALHIKEPVGTFPLLEASQDDTGCRITGAIEGDVAAAREYDTIRVSGRLTAPMVLTCSRCLAEYPSDIDTSFTLYFRKEHHASASDDDDVELGEMDLLTSVYSGEEIDLTHEIDEQLAMEIPVKPLCSDACKGLCHECGTDLNTSACDCRKETVSLAFSALKNFTVAR